MNSNKYSEYRKNGYEVSRLHSGQKRPYGDSYYEFLIKSEKPESEVKKFCVEVLYPCALPTEQYLREERAGVENFGDHFRLHFEFKKQSDGVYFYRVTRPSTH